MSASFLLLCFLSLKESTFETRKMFLVSLEKLFSSSRKSKFRISDIQISRRHQMPKHKTINTFYGQFMLYYKRKKLSEFFAETTA